MMFKWLPDTDIAWGDVWLGAIMTAALFEIGKLLIGLYIGSWPLNRHTEQPHRSWLYCSGSITTHRSCSPARSSRGFTPSPTARRNLQSSLRPALALGVSEGDLCGGPGPPAIARWKALGFPVLYPQFRFGETCSAGPLRDAQRKIGEMYYEGQGAPKDYAEAIKWLQR